MNGKYLSTRETFRQLLVLAGALVSLVVSVVESTVVYSAEINAKTKTPVRSPQMRKPSPASPTLNHALQSKPAIVPRKSVPVKVAPTTTTKPKPASPPVKLFTSLTQTEGDPQAYKTFYYRDVLARLKKIWTKRPGDQNLIVKASIGTHGIVTHRGGTLLKDNHPVVTPDVEIVKSSGNKETDNAALALIKKTQFAVPPKDSSFDIQITFAGVASPSKAICVNEEGKVCSALVPKLHADAIRSFGNIGPYRKRMLVRIAKNWNPTRNQLEIVVVVTINHAGKLVERSIFTSSGDAKSDEEALLALDQTTFEPLPNWYTGDCIPFKIELAKVEKATQDSNLTAVAHSHENGRSFSHRGHPFSFNVAA